MNNQMPNQFNNPNQGFTPPFWGPNHPNHPNHNNNELERQINRLERQVRQLENRVSKLEANMNYGPNPGMYMM